MEVDDVGLRADKRAAPSGQRRWEIGICGTFDVANYGDLLFPLIAESELMERLGAVTLHRFSYNARTPPDWPYEVTSVTALPQLIHRLDGLIIGGGFLIRFDHQVAPGYVPPSPEIHHPTGYWLTPALIALQHDVPLVWNAPGMHCNVIPAWANPLVEMALTLSRYVSVRDEPSRAALESLTGAPIDVVPDTAFGLPRLVNLEGPPSLEFTRLTEVAGLDGPYIIIQASLGLEGFARFVNKHLERFRNLQFVALPIGPAFGECHDIIDANLPGVIHLNEWPHPLVIAELIGRSAAVVGHSYHLFITALASGVPVFTRQNLSAGKYSALNGFERIFVLPHNGQPDLEWFLARVGRATPAASERAMYELLRNHWDRIAAALRGGRAATAPALNRFWQSLPNLLENAATREDEAFTALAKDRVAKQKRLDEVVVGLAVARQQIEERRYKLHDAAKQLTAAGAQTAVGGTRMADPKASTSVGVDPVRFAGRQLGEHSPNVIQLERIERHRIETDPYGWAAINNLFKPDDAAKLADTYPHDHFKLVAAHGGEKDYEYEARELIGMGVDVITNPGDLSDVWQALATDLLSPEYRAALSTLTGCDLAQALMEVNVFHYGPGAFLGPHPDLRDKLVTHVLYFNGSWNRADGGCLSILRSADPADLVAEILPIVGNSAVIVRSENSWHAVSRVVNDSASSRRSITATFYRPGSMSSMWPPDDATPTHNCVLPARTTDGIPESLRNDVGGPVVSGEPSYMVDVGVRDAEILRLQEVLAEQSAWNLQLRDHASASDAEVLRLQAVLSEQMDWNLQLREHVSASDAEIWRLQEALSRQTDTQEALARQADTRKADGLLSAVVKRLYRVINGSSRTSAK